MTTIIPKVTYLAWGHKVTAYVEQTGKYYDGSPALQLFDAESGEQEATLTVCVPGTPLHEDEYLIKAWEENEPAAAAVLATGVFEDTGRRVATGWVEAQVWRKVS